MTNWPTLKSTEIARQKGSHARFEHADGRATTLPLHADQDIGRGLFRKILRDIEMSIEDFRKLL